MAKWNTSSLEIKTRSVEKVLVPLVAQVGVLVNNGFNEIEGKTKRFLSDMLPNLELAVCKFTSIGHEMGNMNHDIRDEMSDACDATNKACSTIVSVLNTDSDSKIDKKSLAESARLLLSAITRILILSDKTAVKKMVLSADKVDRRLCELENVSNFTEFVNAFSQFGGDMVELAYVSGERQNDLKNDLQRAEVCGSRAILEKSTMMLLTTCKSCLRHPDSPLALGNRNAVFKSMRNAMKILKAVIQDNQYPDSNISHGMYMYLKEIQNGIRSLSNTQGTSKSTDILEQIENFAVSMDDVISIQQIDLQLTANMKELQQNLRNVCANEKVARDKGEFIQVLNKIKDAGQQIVDELRKTSVQQVNDVFTDPSYKAILQELKKASLSGELQEVVEIGGTLEKELLTIVQVSKLVKNTSDSEACIITASKIEENLISLLPQLIDASKMLAAHPSSKITQENLEVFIDVWDTQVDELSTLMRNVTQTTESNESAEWLSVYIPMASKLKS